MINYYEKFVQPSKIIKDINYYYDQIKDLICNDIFSQYVYNKRKKTNTTFTIKNHLSCCDSTRLRFNNDTIIINFNQTDKSKVKITKPIYKKYKIEGITFFIDISLNEDEEKHKMIYPDNNIFHEIRKYVNEVNEFYIKKLRKSEISKFKIVYKKLSTIDESPYRDWNRLIYLIKDCVNPTFNEDLNKFNEIINGIDCSTISLVFKMMHNTQFFKRYEHYNQIKFDKFIRSIRKECQEDDLLELSNKLAGCFGHVNDDYNECVSFLKNVILHFNTICYVKEMKINLFTERVWKKSN